MESYAPPLCLPSYHYGQTCSFSYLWCRSYSPSGQSAVFNDDHLNLEEPDFEGWNVVEWDQLQQNPTWLETGMAVPDFIITALANIDHFREEAPAWLSLHVPPIILSFVLRFFFPSYFSCNIYYVNVS